MTLVFGIIASVAALFTLAEFVRPGSTRRLAESIVCKTRTREEEINLKVIGASETRAAGTVQENDATQGTWIVLKNERRTRCRNRT